MSTFSLPLLKGVEETSKVLAKVLQVVLCLGRVSQGGKVISIGRKMMEKIKGSVSSLILYLYESKTHEFAQEADVSNTKPITKQGFYPFKVCLMLLLVLTNGTRGVGGEDIGSLLIPGDTAMNSLLVKKNLRGHKREMLGTEAAATDDSINYKTFQRGYSPPNNPVGKQANPHQRPCNPGEYCRQGKKEKKD